MSELPDLIGEILVEIMRLRLILDELKQVTSAQHAKAIGARAEIRVARIALAGSEAATKLKRSA
jgi:hypothetical protein